MRVNVGVRFGSLADSALRHAAAMLVNKSVEDLDSVRTRPMIEELVLKSGYRVEDSAVNYWG